jgi:hypothetical protein
VGLIEPLRVGARLRSLQTVMRAQLDPHTAHTRRRIYSYTLACMHSGVHACRPARKCMQWCTVTGSLHDDRVCAAAQRPEVHAAAPHAALIVHNGERRSFPVATGRPPTRALHVGSIDGCPCGQPPSSAFKQLHWRRCYTMGRLSLLLTLWLAF